MEVSQEQEQEREHYAAYVWRMMVDLEDMSVVLLGQQGRVGPNHVAANRVEPQKMDVDDSAAVEEQLATVDQERNGEEETDALGDMHGDFVLDPALAMEAQATQPSLHQAYEASNAVNPDATLADAANAAIAQPNATPADDVLATVNSTDASAGLVPEPIDMEKELEAEKHDLMLLKDKYGDKVVMRASEAEVMNTLTGSYVRVRPALPFLSAQRADMSLVAWSSFEYRIYGVAVHREGKGVWYVGVRYREEDRAEAVDGVLSRQDVDGHGSCVSRVPRRGEGFSYLGSS